MDDFEEFAALVDEIESIPEGKILDEDGFVKYYYCAVFRKPTDADGVSVQISCCAGIPDPSISAAGTSLL